MDGGRACVGRLRGPCGDTVDPGSGGSFNVRRADGIGACGIGARRTGGIGARGTD